MGLEICENYDFTMQEEEGDEFKLYLREILNKADTSLQPPKSRRFIVRVIDDRGDIAGGAIVWMYWGWLEVTQLALEEKARGQGLGRRLMNVIEDKARAEGCSRARVEAFGHQALGFYKKLGYRIVGKLEDFPEGFDYYWTCKDL